MVNLQKANEQCPQKTIDYRAVRKVVRSLDMLVPYWNWCIFQTLRSIIFSPKSLLLFSDVLPNGFANIYPAELQGLKESVQANCIEQEVFYMAGQKQMKLSHQFDLNLTPPNQCIYHGKEFLNKLALLEFLFSKVIGARISLFRVKVELIMTGEYLPLISTKYPFLRKFYHKK